MLEHGVVFCLVVVQLVWTWLCWNMIMSEHDYVGTQGSVVRVCVRWLSCCVLMG